MFVGIRFSLLSQVPPDFGFAQPTPDQRFRGAPSRKSSVAAKLGWIIDHDSGVLAVKVGQEPCKKEVFPIYTLAPQLAHELLGWTGNVTRLELDCYPKYAPTFHLKTCNGAGCDEFEWLSRCVVCDPSGTAKCNRRYVAGREWAPGELVSVRSDALFKFVCPRRIPIAVMTLAKAASGSAYDWVFQMDSLRSMTYEWKYFFPSRSSDERFANNLIQTLRSRYGPCYNQHSDAHLDFTQKEHFYISRSFETDVPRLRLPAHMCLPTCRTAVGRSVVVVLRHPYARVQSLYNMILQGRPWNQSKFNSWALDITALPDKWMHALKRLKAYMQGFQYLSFEVLVDVVSAQVGVQLPVSAQVFTHAMPVGELAFILGVKLDDVIPLRIEHLSQDLEMLQQRLCREHRNCDPLPSFRWINRRPSKRRARWPEKLRVQTRARYNAEFEHFGYVENLLG